MIKKYIDKNSIVFGLGVLVGGIVFNTVLKDKISKFTRGA